MVKNNINIFEFNLLYQILNENNSNFFFELKNYTIDDIEKVKSSNSIVLSTISQKNYLLNDKKINKDKIIFFSKKGEKFKNLNNLNIIFYPFDFYYLIEKINISLIKLKYNEQSNIKLANYILNLNSRSISDKKNKLKLTEKEINMILFLNEKKKPQRASILQNEVWGYSSKIETHTVETHIYRLRKKIEHIFHDKYFILSNDSGYYIK